MTRSRKISAQLLALFAVLQASLSCIAQSEELDPEKWAIELSKIQHSASESVTKLVAELVKVDSIKGFQFLDHLQEKGKLKGDHFQARFNVLKARVIFLKNGYYELYYGRKPNNVDVIKEELTRLYSSAMDMAYRSEDNYLVAFVSYYYATTMVLFGEIGLSVMYAKNSIDLYEKLSYNVLPGHYQILAELLYRVRDYDECIEYARKAVAAWQKSPNEYKRATISCMNTVALGYHRQKKYDSAFIFYNEALQLAKKEKDTVWTGIVSGNMGQAYFAQGKYDTAYSLLKMDYQISRDNGYYDNAANSLQFAARVNLALGNKPAALAEVREAFQLLKKWPDANYLRNSYSTATQIFRELGAYDSAFYYNNLYSAINDSLEKVVATSSLAISKARLNDETSRYNIQSLNRNKRSQLLYRNSIIVLIILVSIIALLYVNRLRIKQVHKQRLALQEQNAAEALAREQLHLVTQNLIEKTSLAEELQRQLNNRTVSVEKQELATTISNLTILTESDWEKFKSLFEQLYPGFFINLREKVPDMTIAELRMAALTRLRLSTNEIASILGISANSVYKSKQRLRQRLNVDTEASVEEVIANI